MKQVTEIYEGENHIWADPEKQVYRVSFHTNHVSCYYGKNLAWTYLLGYIATKYPKLYFKYTHHKIRGWLEKHKNL
jgi:hypothetical protein